jgi:hypothetical protein
MSNTLSSKRDLTRLLDSILLPFAFIRTKDDWYLDNQECITVIGLGKSLYGGQFSISIALLLKELNPELLPYPPFYLCNFRQGIQFIVPNQSELKAALNLENNLPATDRANIISIAVNSFALPFILHLNTGRLIAHEIKSNKNFAPYCRLDLKLALKSKGYLSEEDLRDQIA